MDKVRFGVIGAGDAANFHTLAFKNRPEANLKFVSVYDVNEKKCSTLAKRMKLMPCSDLEGFFGSGIDAVLICVPHYLHAEYVASAAAAGKHILCEKPMAPSLEECDAMINATNRAGVKFMIAENHRFLPAHRIIKETLEAGLLGDVYLGRTYEGAFCPASQFLDAGCWHFTCDKGGGGVLMDQGVHKFALLNWLLGEVECAQAWLGKALDSPDCKGEDNAVMHLQYRNGAMIEVTLSSTTVHPLNNNTELHGTKGHLLEDHSWEKPVRLFSSHPDAKVKGSYYEIETDHGAYPMYYIISAYHEDTHFADCIQNDRLPEFTPEQARGAVEVVLLGYLSARLGRTTTMDELALEVAAKGGSRHIIEEAMPYIRKNFCQLQWK
jgi:UDP-N-acetyl-2-amino-2-deoxyglucuronate dehydrogenase